MKYNTWKVDTMVIDVPKKLPPLEGTSFNFNIHHNYYDKSKYRVSLTR